MRGLGKIAILAKVPAVVLQPEPIETAIRAKLDDQ